MKNPPEFEELQQAGFQAILRRLDKFDLPCVPLPLLGSELGQEVHQLMRIQEPHKDRLEKLAQETISRIFGLQSEELILNIHLGRSIEEVSVGSPDFNIQRPDTDISPEAQKELEKRHLANSLIHGGAVCIQEYFHLLKPDLDRMHPELFPRTEKVMALSMLMFHLATPAMMEMAAESDMAGGKVWLDNQDYRIINVRAVTFPLLLHEATKGVIEALSVGGYPQGPEAQQVMDLADRVVFEPIHIRQGPEIWRAVVRAFNQDEAHARERSFMVKSLFELPPDEFKRELKAMIAGQETEWLQRIKLGEY